MEQSSVKNYSSTTAAVKMPHVQSQISAVLAGNWNSGVETHPLRRGQVAMEKRHFCISSGIQKVSAKVYSHSGQTKVCHPCVALHEPEPHLL